jgi:uncharacterized membrane protein YebE (DUF533 family)
MTIDLAASLEAVSEHALIREYGSKERYGIERPVSDEFHIQMGRAILAVAGADGELSAGEMTFYLGRARKLGMSADGLEIMRSFDYRSIDLGAAAALVPATLRKVLLYEAILVARVDGFAEREREAARRWAAALGLDPSLVAQVEEHVEREDGLRTARIELLTP